MSQNTKSASPISFQISCWITPEEVTQSSLWTFGNCSKPKLLNRSKTSETVVLITSATVLKRPSKGIKSRQRKDRIGSTGPRSSLFFTSSGHNSDMIEYYADT